MSTTTLLVSTFPPFSSLTLTLPSDTPLSNLPSYLPDYLPSFEDADLALSLPSGILPPPHTLIGDIRASRDEHCADSEDVCLEGLSNRLLSLRLTPRLRGGKGGFGSQLRAAGGRMSSQKTSNNDSCRDLNGRRLSTIKEAKALAAYIEAEPDRKKAKQDADRAKLEALERKLGISAGRSGEAGPSTGQKRRFDDTEYLEQSQEIVDNVKNAVMAGILKKKKKAGKTKDSPDAEEKPKSPPTAVEVSAETEGLNPEKKSEEISATLTERVSEAPAAAAVAGTVAASLAAVGA